MRFVYSGAGEVGGRGTLTRGFAVGCCRVERRQILNCFREAWYGRLLYIGHHTILGQMEIVESHTRIALLESFDVTSTVLGLSMWAGGRVYISLSL